MELLRPVPLTRAHDRTGLRSGADTLDEYLKQTSTKAQKTGTAVVWVVTDTALKVVAYMTLSMTAVARTSAPAFRRGSPVLIPGLLIGRLAVDQRYQRKGLGTRLAIHGLNVAVTTSADVGFKAVFVNARDADARRWWVDAMGFLPCDPDDPDCLDLYRTTADIRATYEAHARATLAAEQ
ncbi:hypothetical protein CLV28_0916 [Sediminihabitans luteus]|uniref:N-acetyltransferase domain-containing protein n=1 Tax=Sediminihabitans luteus TaxID=1138585 RepID=A0A2M9D0K3_9CELL|nr:GNAT family N-acetyltransferase [Sediminihabitans luteus]PJJ77690.1 hypothetical protein CLV28_0916 [Sediminihabitans luteus]GIJ00083.1 N-acetyltransferase GCN5 [Sediminihabitans luteus]